MKVQISKKEWCKATTNQMGRFWCPMEKQIGLLEVWPEHTKITIEATPVKKVKQQKKTKQQIRDEKWLQAIEMVDERLANNPSIPDEARRMLIKEVYQELKK